MYTKVEGVLVFRTANAVLVDFNVLIGEELEPEWIPLSLIHGGDEQRLTADLYTEKVKFRLMSWKAKQLGLD